MSIIIHAADGSQVDISAELKPEVFRHIQAKGVTPRAHLNSLVATAMNGPDVFEQVADQLGFHIGRNSHFGVRPNTMDAIMNPTIQGAITRDAELAPRVFFPMFALNVMEAALQSDRSPILRAWGSMVSVRDVIPTDTYERPIIDFTESDKPRGAHTAQLSEPRVMVKATVSSKIYRIGSESIGVEYSDQAAKALGLDFLMKGFARRAEQAAIDRVYGHIDSLLNGNPDMDMVALASVPGAVKTAQSFDSTITQAGQLTQKAWVKFLYENSSKRSINFVICDLDSAMKIEGRVGRPVITGDNATSKRIDTLENVINPMWPDQVQVFIMPPEANFPANTIVGLDSQYAVHHVISSALQYSGAEEWSIRRSTKLRFDLGETCSRLFDEAWSVMTLTV